MMHFGIISVVLILYICNEIINVGFKRLLHVCLMIFIAQILHSHTVVHVLSPIAAELSDFM